MLSLPLILLTIAGLLVLVGLLQPLASRLNLSHSVLLAVVGTCIGVGASFLLRADLSEQFDQIAALLLDFPINAQGFIYIFLPALLFEAALAIDVRRMLDDAAPILVMAVIAVVVTTAVVGLSLWPLADVPLAACLLLGAIVATTDPAAVIAIFRDLGAPGRLTRLVEGESLLNDAAAIALFTILLGILIAGREETLAGATFLFVKAFAGGALFGAAIARLAMGLVPRLRDSRLAEATLTLALPYLVFVVADQWLQVSGVVAVVACGLVVSAMSPSRFAPENRTFILEMWGQLAFWSGSLIFILASMLIPRLLLGASGQDLLLILVVTVAALLARALVVFGLLPLLSLMRLAERVSHRFKLVILWGGLRGALTLALALAVTENRLVDEAVQQFVAILATGYVLVTLLVNGTTLRPLMHLLRLDRLSPVDQALRHQALALALGNVRDQVNDVAADHRIGWRPLEEVLKHYDQRVGEAAGQDAIDQRISDRDRITLGLIAIAIREHECVLEHYRHRSASRRILERLLSGTNQLIDATRAEGRIGYNRAVRRQLRFPPSFRSAHGLHRFLRIDWPLRNELADRFELLLVGRMIQEELRRFVSRRMGSMLGQRVSELLSEILATRLAATSTALDALRLQYPAYAEELERRFLRQTALRLEAAEYQQLFEEGLIGPELNNHLKRDVLHRRAAARRRPALDLGLDVGELVRQFPLFEALDAAQLDRIKRLLKPRFAVPGERLIELGDRGEAMFFISSGAVEVAVGRQKIRLGRGDFFGELALLGNRRRQADVTALTYCQLLVLAAEDLRALISEQPAIGERINRVAEMRRAMNRVVEQL